MRDSPPSVLGHRPFLLFFLARILSTIALQMQIVGVGWQVYSLTHNPLDLGLVGLVQFIPAVSLVLLTGHAIDRYSRRNIMRACQVLICVAVAALALGTASGWLTRDVIFAVVFVIGTARAFESPTLQALVPGIVPLPLLPRAVAASASANQIATITGPAIGGLIYALDPTLMYSLCALFYLASIILLSFMRSSQTVTKREPLTLATVFAGVAFIRRNPLILGAISMDMFAVMLGGATALLPVFAHDIFEIGPWGLGLLRACMAVGALSMSIFLTHHQIKRHTGRIMFTAVTVFGLATIVFALSRSVVLTAIALVALGAADVTSVVIRMSLVQLSTPDNLRGRVTAINSLFVGTSNLLGEFESGLTAAWFGTVPAVLIGGCGTLLVVAAWSKLFPALARVDTLEAGFAAGAAAPAIPAGAGPQTRGGLT